ncbi:GTP-binding protein HSR1 [Alteromonas sp. MB-3u-76]|uniref:GTPase family protein n=1 Tax=Alteromonas sp. MB-3u-76 TaxID=2058133 RepID=UPI000C3184D4|nr:GTPase [Alteromonas sp. MB-3u-76]AUC88563.1 GTP-binding protein HSR1 [Alteromonas sp. MB-3u-76]
MQHFLILGGTGVGKSSTINALTQKNMAKVGYGSEPKTRTLMGYRAKSYVLWDTPGLGEGISEDANHIKMINGLIKRQTNYNFKHVFLIIEANKRDFGTVYKVFDEIVSPSFSNNVTVLINQADRALNGRFWNSERNEPAPELLQHLDQKAKSTQNRIKENTGISVPMPTCYSASTGYGLTRVDELLQVLSQQMS